MLNKRPVGLIALPLIIGFLVTEHLPKVKLVQVESVQTLFNITRIASRKSYLVIICPNAYAKLTKSEIRSSSSRFEHCSESLIQPIGSHTWSSFAPIHMTNLPKVKLDQVVDGSNIAQNNSSTSIP